MGRDVRTGSAVCCAEVHLTLGASRVLAGVDLQVDAGQSVAIMGPSGSGKTSLLHLLSGLLTPDDGRIVVDGAVLSDMSEKERCAFRLDRVGMVFQFGELVPELTAAENAALPGMLSGSASALEDARAMLAMVGLDHRTDAWPTQMSGGEVQRVGVARAIVRRPTIVLADEPTGSLDEESSEEICDLLIEVARELNAALIVATHDGAVAARMDRTLRLRHGLLE